MKHSIVLMLFLFVLGSCKKEVVNNGQRLSEAGNLELQSVE